MTPLEKCVSKETAERLKAAGWTAETEHWWCVDECNTMKTKPTWSLREKYWSDAAIPKLMLAAPDATEIGAELPKYEKFFTRFTDTQCVIGSGSAFDRHFYGSNEAEARAEMWLSLKDLHHDDQPSKEQGLI